MENSLEVTIKLNVPKANAEDTKILLGVLAALKEGELSKLFSSDTVEAEAAEAETAEVETAEVEATDVEPKTKSAPTQESKKVESKKVEYKSEDVRKAMASKLAKHRTKLIDKLQELGAKNVSTLPQEKFADFIDYCNSLED